MFPPLFPFFVPALAPVHKFASLIWLGGVLCLWLTRYTHQFARRSGFLYYAASAVLRPIGVILIAAGWLALYAPVDVQHSWHFGWLPRKDWIDVLSWAAMLLFTALGIWSVIVLGLRRSFLFRRYDDPLITQGPYALVRHPQFLSAIGVTFFGAQLYDPAAFPFMDFTVYGSVGANWALFALALWCLAILEDKELEAHFGDAYREYARQVPRLLPN